MTWTGAVFTDADKKVTNFCVQHHDFARELAALYPRRWELVFSVNGPCQDEVAAITQAVCLAAESMNQSGPHNATAPSVAGCCYVYAYFDDGNAAWDRCFYVGKGTASHEALHLGRWTEHVRDTLKTAPALHNEKMRRIYAWIVSHNLTNHRHQHVRAAAADNLIRKLYVFDGVHAESQAFYVEYFLISHALGTHRVANDTRGNSTRRQCSAIALPRHLHLNRSDTLHQAIWRHTVGEFTLDPKSKTLDNTWGPALIAMFAAPYAANLDLCLRPLGLVPHQMHGQGRLMGDIMPRPNIQVTGASDATLTYSTAKRPYYRLELRFGATQCLTSISLRPYGNTRKDISKFLQYLDGYVMAPTEFGDLTTVPGALPVIYGHNDYVKNRNNWPFYKPYAQGADGNMSSWFDIADPTGNSQSGSTDWINGKFELNLVDAISLIIKAFV